MTWRFLCGRPDERTPVDVHQVDIPIIALPAPLEGLRLAVLSDLHYGRFVWSAFTRRVVELVNRCEPDLVLLPGDMVNHRLVDVQSCAELLAGLRAPYGVLACPGNHDHYTGWASVRQALEQAGIVALNNESRTLSIRGAGLIVAAVDDPMMGRPDVRTALTGADPRLPVILMSHNPDLAEDLPPDVRVDLMVCGHSHGGQIALPKWAPITQLRHRRYWRGLVRGPRCLVYTSRGLGMVGLPIRLNSPPEIPVLRLAGETSHR